MKCIGLFLIFLILHTNIIKVKSDIDSHSFKTEKIMKIIHTHKNYIFSEMRKVKNNFPSEYHDEVEKVVKNYETKMLSGDEKFEDYIMSKFSYLKYILNEKRKANEYYFDYKQSNSNSDLKFDWNDLIDNYENHEFLEKISDHLFKLNPYERKKMIGLVLKKFKDNEFYKNIAKKIFEKAYFYHKNHFNSLDKVLSFLVYSLSSGKGFESNKINYKLNENNNSNSLNDHYLYHNGNIPNSFKVNKNFKRYIDFLQQKYMKEVLNKEKTFNLKILNKLTHEEKTKFNNYFNEFLKESILNNEEFKEIYTKNKLQDSDFLNLINKENSKNNIKDKFYNNVTIEENSQNDFDKDKLKKLKLNRNPIKNSSLNPQSFISFEEKIENSDSKSFKSYEDYLEHNTKEGFFHREKNVLVRENNALSLKTKIEFVNQVLTKNENEEGGILTSDIEDPKKVNEIIKTKINYEKNQEKKKKDEEYKLMMEMNKKIQNEKKAKIKEAIVEVAKTAKASKEMKVVQAKIDGSMSQTKASVGNLEKGLIPLLLKPIMIIFELLAKIPTKIIVAATKPLIKLSIDKEKAKNKALRESEKKKKNLDLSGKTKNPNKVGTPGEDENDEEGFNCDAADKKLKQAIKDQLELLEKEEEEAKDNLNEINPDLMNDLGSPSKSASLLSNIIIEFIKKLIIMVIQHVPFFFFKICIPPGPLTFGCCPEAAFVPEQIYSIFSVFEKVERFKVVAKGYPTWLAKVNHADFGEDDYYACAQSMLTLTESTLFNYCNMQTLVVIHPINLQGMYPGDLPLCFWACLQTMVICRVWINQLPTCDALINLQVLIKAMMFIPDRIKLGYMFNMCTYIPFLIRWDLVPKWKEEQKPAGHKDSDDELGPKDDNTDNKIKGKKTAQPRIELNCADPENNLDLNRKPEKSDNISPFAEALLNISADGEKILNDVHNEVLQKEKNSQMLNQAERKNLAIKLLRDLRNPVKRTKIKKQKVNVVIVEWDPKTSIKENESEENSEIKEDGAISGDYINNPDNSENSYRYNIFNPKVTDILGNSSNGNEIIIKHIELYSDNKLDRRIESKFPFNALRIYVDANMTGKFYENLRSVTGLPEDINDRSLS